MKNFRPLIDRWGTMICVLLTVLSVPAGPALLLSQGSIVETVRKVQPAVVTVLSLNENGDLLRRGSGFFVDQEHILVTTRHVLFGAHSAEIRTHDGRTFRVQSVVSEDESQDLVHLRVAGAPAALPFLKLSDTPPEVGERVLVIGNPMGFEGTVTDGMVSALRDMPGYGLVLQISAPISPGSSGGPVLNSQGDVIGIVDTQVSQVQNLNFAVLASHIITMKTRKEVRLAEWSKRSVKQWADSADGLYNAGLEQFSKRDYQKALSFLEQAVNKKDAFPEAWYLIGYCNALLGEHEKALEAYRKAINLRPDYGEAHYNMGASFSRLGRYSEAISAFRQAAALKPDSLPAQMGLGFSYVQLRDWSHAEAAYRRAAILSPEDSAVHRNLGVVYMKMNQLQSSIDAFQTAHLLQPDDSVIQKQLEILFLALKHNSPAVAVASSQSAPQPAVPRKEL